MSNIGSKIHPTLPPSVVRLRYNTYSSGHNISSQADPDGTAIPQFKQYKTVIREDCWAASTSFSHTLLMDNIGTVWAYGDNLYSCCRNSGKPQSGIVNIDFIALLCKYVLANGHSSFWITQSGGLFGVGQYTQPSAIPSDPILPNYSSGGIDIDVVKVCADESHIVYLKDNGEVWSYGENEFAEARSDGVAMAAANNTALIYSNCIDIAAGGQGTWVVTDTGDLYGWGANVFGEHRGDGVYGGGSEQLTPFLMTTNVEKVSYCGGHLLVLKNNGDVFAVGANTGAEVSGDGTGTVVEPSLSLLTTGAMDISTINTGSFIWKTDYTLWGCGNNSWGQILGGAPFQDEEALQVIENNRHTRYLPNNGAQGCNTFIYGVGE